MGEQRGGFAGRSPLPDVGIGEFAVCVVGLFGVAGVELGSWLTFAAALTTTLLLSETSIDYLHFAFHGRPERWLVGLVVLGAAAVVLTSFVLVLRAPGEQSSLGALKVATVCVVVLGVGASWLSMTLARFPKDWLTSPAPPIVLMVLALTFALPAVIAGAICFSAPSAREM